MHNAGIFGVEFDVRVLGAVMKILLTGGCGFIGSAAVRYLIENGHEVLNIDKLTYAGDLRTVAGVSDHSGYQFLNADITDSQAMNAAMQDFQPDSVLHLAAESHVDRSIDGPSVFIDTNIAGTSVLLDAALAYWQELSLAEQAVFKFVHVSTDEVYGSLGKTGLFDEQTPYDPSSPYSASKAASDHLVRAWQRTFGLPTMVTNCSNNYGPFQFPEKLIPTIIRTALAGEPIPVYGKGENIRDWLYVNDHVRALFEVLTNGMPGETYNIGGNSERKNIDIVNLVCQVLDRLMGQARVKSYCNQISFVTDRPGHDFRYAIDASKIKRELGWEPEAEFEKGIENTVIWYLENRSWWQEANKNAERMGLIGERK